MGTILTGDQRERISGKLFELGRQAILQREYGFDPEKLDKFLQQAIEGRFDDNQRWREEDGVIYFEVTSDGTTGQQWIERLEKQRVRLTKWAKDVLNSPDFKPTSGVVYQIAVLKGTLFTDSNRITKKIPAEADHRKLERPNAEIACLIREMFSDDELEAMGLWWIVVFHEPIKDSNGDPSLLIAYRGRGGRWLDACSGRPDDFWGSGYGFAFAVPQVSLQ